MKSFSSFFSTHKRTLAALLFGLAFSATVAFAVPPSTEYSPGETLDPNCAPGDTNCAVIPTASAIEDGAVEIADFSASGTPSASTFLRGDNTWATVSGSGTVTSFAFTNGGGFTGNVSNATSTPTLSLTLQDAVADGSTKGAAAFTAADFNASSGLISIDYTNGQAASGSTKGFLTSADWTTFNGKESALTFSIGLTRTTNTITVNTTQNIAKLSNLTSNGFIKTSGSDGTLSVDTSTYLTGNEAITLSGDISGSGTTTITTTIGSGKVTNTMLAGSITAAKLVGTDIATVGTIGTGTWQGTVVGATYGGTGVNNGSNTITLAGNLVTTGAFNTTFAASATGTYTLPSATSTLLANNLGISGGSTLVGGTGSGENLTLSSTSNATKGKIIFGSASAYDQVNDRFGIAQTTPLARLHVQRDAIGATQDDSYGILLQNSTAAAAGAQQYSPSIVFAGNGWKSSATAASQDVRFRIYNSPVQGAGSASGLLNFESALNGGAYTTLMTLSSAQALSLNSAGTIFIGSGLALTNVTAQVPTVFGGTAVSSSLTLKSTSGVGSSDFIRFQVGNNGATEAMRIITSGFVGIANTAPGVALHIGSSSTTDATTLLRLQDSNSTCNFTADSGAPTCGSDRTLKKDIESMDNADLLARVSALNPVTYRWLTDTDDAKLQHGFIAQEVEEQFPELVTENVWGDGTMRKFLNIGGLMPYAIGAIKQMNLQIVGIADLGTTNTWRDSLLAWFGNAGNGIESFFSKKVTTSELCVGDETDQVCVTKDQLRTLLQQGGSASVAPIVIPDPVPEEATGETPEETPVEETVTPEPEAIEPTPEPEPAPEPTAPEAPAEAPALTE